ncbi:MAG: hypothetical protein WCD80_11545 [Desulfobaccales bacterium]
MSRVAGIILFSFIVVSLVACTKPEITSAPTVTSAPNSTSSTTLTATSKSMASTTVPKSSQPIVDTNVLEVKADDLYREYQRNMVAADQKYKDRLIRVNGNVWKIDKLPPIMPLPEFAKNKPYVGLGFDSGFGGLIGAQCFFKNENEIAKLRVGQLVTLIGTCYGIIDGDSHPSLTNCSIVQ